MGTYFDINGTAMIYINDKFIRNAKTKKEADDIINKACQTLTEIFKENLQALAKENPEIFDPISFDTFYFPGVDIRVFQNHAHGPATGIDDPKQANTFCPDQIPIHNTATLTINGTFETDDYDEHLQLIINAFNRTFNADNRYYDTDYSLFRLNLISMWNGQQDATIFDSNKNIITIPLTKG